MTRRKFTLERTQRRDRENIILMFDLVSKRDKVETERYVKSLCSKKRMISGEGHGREINRVIPKVHYSE